MRRARVGGHSPRMGANVGTSGGLAGCTNELRNDGGHDWSFCLRPVYEMVDSERVLCGDLGSRRNRYWPWSRSAQIGAFGGCSGCDPWGSRRGVARRCRRDLSSQCAHRVRTRAVTEYYARAGGARWGLTVLDWLPVTRTAHRVVVFACGYADAQAGHVARLDSLRKRASASVSLGVGSIVMLSVPYSRDGRRRPGGSVAEKLVLVVAARRHKR